MSSPPRLVCKGHERGDRPSLYEQAHDYLVLEVIDMGARGRWRKRGTQSPPSHFRPISRSWNQLYPVFYPRFLQPSRARDRLQAATHNLSYPTGPPPGHAGRPAPDIRFGPWAHPSVQLYAMQLRGTWTEGGRPHPRSRPLTVGGHGGLCYAYSWNTSLAPWQRLGGGLGRCFMSFVCVLEFT